MDAKLCQLSKHEMQQIEWLMLARGDVESRPYLRGLMVLGDRLVCVDGFRAHSIPAPSSILEDKTLNGKVLHVVTAIDSTQDACAVGFRVGDGDDGTIPQGADNLEAKGDDQAGCIAVNPQFLREALAGFSGMVTIRYYNDSTYGAKKLAFEQDGKRVLVMLMYSPDKGGETIKISGITSEDSNEPTTAN